MKEKYPVLSPQVKVDDTLFDMAYSVRDIPASWHGHSCIEIVVACGGIALHRRDEATEQLQRGDISIILPSGLHELTECRQFEHFTISCTPEVLSRLGINLSFIHGARELFAAPEKSVSFHLNHSEFNDARRLINIMWEAYNRDRISEKGDLRSCFAMLICLFAQSYSLHHHQDSAASRLDNAVTYMNEHYKGKVVLPEIAAVAALSVSQFVRVFKAKFGNTPIDYVIELRLNESRRLLKYSDLAVSEIAYLVGFSDSNYFSRLFKKRFQCTPTKCRNNND